MLGTAVAFAIGGPAIVGIVALAFWLFGGAPLGAVAVAVLRSAPICFIIGLAFSGLVALLAQGRMFEKLSIKLFAALGAVVGFALFMLMGLGGAFEAWSATDGIVNLLLLTSVGAGGAAATLALARKTSTPAAVGAEEETLSLGEGAAIPVDMSREGERVRHRE